MGAFSNNNRKPFNQNNNQAKPQQQGEKKKVDWAATLNVQEGEGDSSKLTRITGLNKYTSKSGVPYYSGRSKDGVRYLIFLNEKAPE